MSRRISRFSVVALVALTAVIVCIVFVVLRLFSEPPIVYEDEIPVVDTNEIPEFAAEVSTISLPIKADYAALASEIRKEAKKKIKIPGRVDKNSYTILDEGWGLFQLIFYYTADLLSLDVSLRDGSAFAFVVAAKRLELERMNKALKKLTGKSLEELRREQEQAKRLELEGMNKALKKLTGKSLEELRREQEQMINALKEVFGKDAFRAEGPLAPIETPERLREQEILLADRPVLTVTGEVHLSGPIQHKSFGEFIAEYLKYDGKFQFSKNYVVGLDKSAKLIFQDLGQANMAPLGLAKLKVAGIPFEDWFGGLKKWIVPVLGEKIDEALKEHVEKDYLTPFYDKGWVALHKPIELTSGVWLVFHPKEFEVAQLRSSGITLEWPVFHPEGFEVAQLRSSGTTLETTVTVLARPEVVLGDKPRLPEAPPMPPVRLGEAKGGLHVVVDAIVPLEEAERLLNKELGGLEDVIHNQAKVKVKVPKARIYSRENWLRLELLFTKPFRGSVFLEGAPRYDPENNELYVEGLDFTVDTKNVLAKSASWLLEHPLLKDYLQMKVRLPVGGPLAKVGEAISGYEPELEPGVVFQVGDTSFKMLGVYNTREAIHFIVQADGTAEVLMKPPAPSPQKNLPPKLFGITDM